MSEIKKVPTYESGSTQEEVCPSCDSEKMLVQEIEHSFLWGAGDDAVEITATLPIIVCQEDSCGEGWLDHTANELKHEAVCEHLGVMTPREIRKLRKETMNISSRDAFAELTGISSASIGRWESGALIQNVAHDRYMRLLQSQRPVIPQSLLRNIVNGDDLPMTQEESSPKIPVPYSLTPLVPQKHEEQLRRRSKQFNMLGNSVGVA